jgi:hypothetical protein
MSISRVELKGQLGLGKVSDITNVRKALGQKDWQNSQVLEADAVEVTEYYRLVREQMMRPADALLMKFIGGHPYLSQIALFHVSQQKMLWENLIETAILPKGIFNSHIRQQLLNLKTHPTLLDVMHSLASHPKGIKLPLEQAFKLWEMGLIRFQNQLAFPSCELYRQLFTQ